MFRLLNDIEFLNDRKLFEARMFLTRAKYFFLLPFYSPPPLPLSPPSPFFLTPSPNRDKFKPQNFFFLYASSLYLDTFGVDVVTSLPNHPQWGRPKWSQVFEEIARSHENSKIGVFICGPTLLTHEVRGGGRGGEGRGKGKGIGGILLWLTKEFCYFCIIFSNFLLI